MRLGNVVPATEWLRALLPTVNRAGGINSDERRQGLKGCILVTWFRTRKGKLRAHVSHSSHPIR